MNPVIEWDSHSYHRKFGSCISYIEIGGKKEWKYIRSIDGNQLVVTIDKEGPQTLGWVRSENGGFPHHEHMKMFPEVLFYYKEIKPGIYCGGVKSKSYWLISKTHIKSYHIGLSTEGHEITLLFTENGEAEHWEEADLVLDEPISKISLPDLDVFSPNLYRLGTNLYAEGKNNIGFMEKGLCFLKSPRFIPLIKPLLDESWQIETL